MRTLKLLCLALADVHGLTVHLIRHGQTEWNQQGRLQGSCDSPLTPLGIAQAKATGRRLRDTHFDAAYCSPLLRARRTAELVLAELAADDVERPAAPPLRTDERLCERAFGAWEGLTWAEIERDYADERARAQADPHYAISGGGESRQATLDRAVAFFEELCARRDCNSVLLVTHSGTATSFIKYVLGISQAQRRSFEVRNLALNIVEFDEAERAWMVRTLGDTAHLAGCTP